MARLSDWDEQLVGREFPKVTLPAFNLPDIDAEAERKETAQRIATQRVVRRGRDAWEAVTRAETLDQWRAIAAALVIGRDHALRVSGAKAPNGRHYTIALTGWLKQNFGGRPMGKAQRYWCLRFHSNLPAIENWLRSLPDLDRQKLVNPLSVVRRWRRATTPQAQRDALLNAEAAWRRFVACVSALPADQAQLLWQAVSVEAAGRICIKMRFTDAAVI
jgi:hypothetical protein